MPTLAEQWDADVSPELRGLNPDLADRLQQAKDAYKKQYGKDMAITSGYRTKAQQAELASKPNKYPVARPGTSLHESGDAVDIAVLILHYDQLTFSGFDFCQGRFERGLGTDRDKFSLHDFSD